MNTPQLIYPNPKLIGRTPRLEPESEDKIKIADTHLDKTQLKI